MDRVVESVREAEARLESAEARYGTAEDGSILSDGRLPIVKDGVLRVLEFRRPGGGAAIGVLVQWNCHPESLGRNNTLITADFPYYTVKALEDRRGCPVAYFTGAVGGLMSNPRDWKTRDGTVVHENTFEFAEAYGLSAATLAERALEGATPIELAPFRAASRLVMLPLANQGYRQARAAGVLPRQAFAWMGDAYVRGEPLAAGVVDGELAIESEVAYLRLGELHVAGIPGELYPELVYGEFQDPADLGADFIDALLEPPVMKTLPGPKAMLFGLANDEVGYIIPKRQWDEKTPFAYRRKDKQYGEVNSVGPEVAPILMKALEDCVRDMAQESRR
jgi:hypothetical protein